MMFRRPGRVWIPEAPNIILARARECVIKEQPRLGFEGRFNIKLIDSRTGHVKQELDFKNLIVDAGLDYIGNTQSVVSCMAVAQMGTGGTAPTNGDTTLQTGIGTRISRDFSPTISPGPAYAYWKAVYQFTFLEANANGNLAEIGLFSAFSGGTMWTRQILKDGTGTPTTITKTSAERLQVTYELRLYPPTTDVTGTVTISGTPYDYLVRASEIDNTPWATIITQFFAGGANPAYTAESDVLGTITGQPAGITGFGGTDSTTHTVSGSYTGGTFSREHTYVFETNKANYATGIGAMVYGNCSGGGNPWQIQFSPTKIPKTALNRLTLVVNNAWGRYP